MIENCHFSPTLSQLAPLTWVIQCEFLETLKNPDSTVFQGVDSEDFVILESGIILMQS